jgi:hypothetical protein
MLFVMACIGVHKWLQCSPKEASRLVRELRKMEARTLGIPPMPPVGPVKSIRLPDSDAGLCRTLVFYVTEGDIDSDTETLLGTKDVEQGYQVFQKDVEQEYQAFHKEG